MRLFTPFVFGQYCIIHFFRPALSFSAAIFLNHIFSISTLFAQIWAYVSNQNAPSVNFFFFAKQRIYHIFLSCKRNLPLGSAFNYAIVGTGVSHFLAKKYWTRPRARTIVNRMSFESLSSNLKPDDCFQCRARSRSVSLSLFSSFVFTDIFIWRFWVLLFTTACTMWSLPQRNTVKNLENKWSVNIPWKCLYYYGQTLMLVEYELIRFFIRVRLVWCGG